MNTQIRNAAWLLASAAASVAASGCAVQSEHPGENLGETSEASSNNCPGAFVKGIDIASFQHPNGAAINWAQVASAEKFVIIKATEKNGYVNSYYADDIAKARAAGLVAGSYHFLAPSSQTGVSGATQAQHFLAHASIKPGDLPPMLDVETSPLYNGVVPSLADITGWLDTVAAATGRKPMIYIGYYVITALGSPGALKNYAINVPNYSNCPSFPDSYPIQSLVMWQHTSTASVPGISGHVDENKFYGDMGAFLAFAQADQAATGYLDHADCDGIAGWGWDPDQKDTPTHVDVYFDGAAGTPGATGVRNLADHSRADLCTALGSCNHGFSMNAPRSLFDGQSHEVHGYAIDLNGTANGELNDSPKSLTCASLGIPANTVKRWVTDPTTFAAWSFDQFLDVAPIAQTDIDAEPDGAGVSAGPTCVQADDGTPEVWVIDQGLRRHVTDPTSLAAWRLSVTKTPAQDVYANAVGPDWPAAPQLIQGSGPEVYMLDTPLGGGTGGAGVGTGGKGATAGTTSGAGNGAGAGTGGADVGDGSGSGCSVAEAPTSGAGAWAATLGIGLAFVRRRRAIGAPAAKVAR